ncbi:MULTISPECIES: hypothetical protein [Aequorivita]|uniref:DUF2393 domain-containing protein n=1 Tax=Aequorivita iocasae TaxID=2803865 RepID=A0ABX7DSQ6_9FLAO|nr:MULTISPECIES: hypothetical protein [Aequorivita]QQX76651.1 hypothetical protein JK629_15215 [Aequorivita iocasae]UCA56123.1 hypothetical protein LDL78_15285 [Aequorivita sp. F7]
MNEIFDFIKNNTGIFILCVGLLTLIITLAKLFPKRPKLKITGYSRWAGVNATEIRGNDDPSDRMVGDETNASREMLTTITLSLRNTSKKRAFNVRIKKMRNGIRVRKNLPEDYSIEPDGEATIELEYAKRVFGKFKNIKRPEFFKDIDITKDFRKKESIVDIKYENSKGKEYTVSHRLKKSGK